MKFLSHKYKRNNVIDPYRKNRIEIMKKIIQTSFRHVNTNSASSDQRENAILTNFGAKILAGNMVPKHAKELGGTRWKTAGMDTQVGPT